MTWFDGNAWLVWLGVALALAAVEAATVDFVFLMLAGGAVAGSVAAAAGLGVPAQVVVAAFVATALLGIARPMVKKRFQPTDAALGVSGYIGREATVLETVSGDAGRVKIGGEEWSARTAGQVSPIGPGQHVQVVSIAGATAIVVPAISPTASPSQGE